MNIKELAEQAGAKFFNTLGAWMLGDEELERFAELIEQWARADERDKCAQDYLQDCADAVETARLEEREACARLCDDVAEGLVGDDVDGAWGAGHCARTIEARGEK